MFQERIKLNAGDYIAFSHPDIPLPEIQAAVIEDRGREIEVMSTLIAPFRHSGVFDVDRMSSLAVIYPASVAIPQESRRGWQQESHLKCEVENSGTWIGYLIAAFDGVCVIKCGNVLVTGGSDFFEEA